MAGHRLNGRSLAAAIAGAVVGLCAACAAALAQTGAAGPERPAAEAHPVPAGIFRFWTPRGRRGPRELPLTAFAQAAADAYDPVRHDPARRCLAPGMPAMLDTPRPVEFVRTNGGRILMRFEEWSAERTIHMDPNDTPRLTDHSLRGVSFGRWEGETLAIFTSYIRYPYFDASGTPQSELVSVLERYTPSADYTRLDWEITTTDPGTFTEPVVQRGFYVHEPGTEIGPFDCSPAR